MTPVSALVGTSAKLKTTKGPNYGQRRVKVQTARPIIKMKTREWRLHSYTDTTGERRGGYVVYRFGTDGLADM